MAKPHEGDAGSRKHRPLPSVDMALLPHELRALRIRQVTLVLLAVLLTAAALCLSVARPWVTSVLQHRNGAERDGHETSASSTQAIAAAASSETAAVPMAQDAPIEFARPQPAARAEPEAARSPN